MLVIGDGSEHDIDTQCIIEKWIFIELAADTIDLIVVIRVRQVNLIWSDSDNGTCCALN